MAPGTYLERRRIAAGYSLPGLARELLALSGFGTARALDDLHRLHLCLISAEQGTLHHSRARIETIRAFVPLDVSLYLHLVDCERSGAPYRIDGICDVCACSFHDPCVLHVGPTALLGASTCHWAAPNRCSTCAEVLDGIAPVHPASSSAAAGRENASSSAAVGRENASSGAATSPLSGPSIAEQLRQLGDRMQRIASREDARAARQLAETKADQLGQPPFLRVVPTTGEN